ncbi:MAG: trigger factor [Spirochaetales bacterium]|nr:trigger factor [Spirochaetales bacterium]
MISQKEVNLKENSKVFLKITVPGTEVQKEYDELLKEYCEKVQIKGFRKGKVPAEVLIRKYGEEIKGETTYSVIKKSLDEAIQTVEEKPLGYSMPELIDQKVTAEPGKDFTYEVTYDTYPKVELGDYTGIKAEKLQYAIADEDLDRELKAVQDRNSVVKEIKDAAVKKGHIITIDYTELDADENPVEGTAREGFVFEVGTGHTLHKIDEDVVGMKAGEEKIIKKTYDKEYDYKELAGRDIILKVKVVVVKEKILPALDDELAQDVSDKFKTLDDLKKDITDRLTKAAEDKIKEQLATQIIEQIVAASKMDLPSTMIDLELEQSWRNFCQQFNNREDIVIKALEQDGKTKEDLYKDWRPNVEKKIKAEIVLQEIEEKQKITASEEEVDAEVKKFADERGIEFEKAKEQYEAAKMLDYLKRSITREKTFDYMIEQAEVKKGKKIKLLDLLQGNY